ncbi:MAG: Crp/Fnr family transcriptional regulator [Pseudomonadota bacterium]
MELTSFLTPVPLFQGMTRECIAELLPKLQRVTLAKGDVLFRKGAEGGRLFIVQKGAIKIVLPSPQGGEMIVCIFSEGDFLGEMALLDREPRSADAIAVRDSELLAISRRDFIDFLRSNETAMETILSTLSRRLRRTDTLLEDKCFLNISERLAKKLVELSDAFGVGDEAGEVIDIQIPLTQKELAEMVGATRESINKELGELKKAGLITMRGKTICILDRVALRECVPTGDHRG